MKHFELQGGTDNDSEEWIMCVQTAEPYDEPTVDVNIEMALSKFKLEKQLDMIKSRPHRLGGGLKKVIY